MHTHEELMLSTRQQQLFMRSAAGALFPEYYVIRVNQFNDVAKDTLDEWVFYLKNGDIKEGSLAKGLSEVRSKLTTGRLTNEERATYMRHLDNLSHQKSVIFTAKDEGKAEGRVEGLLLVARNMKKTGEPIEKIIAFTGLTKEQIENLVD
jgi:predicted transposase/invertase (TIGR01784 family)